MDCRRACHPVTEKDMTPLRSKKRFTKLWYASKEQGLASCANVLALSLNFMGAGVPAKSMYIAANALYVSVGNLSLTDVGTPRVMVRHEESNLLPLVSLSVFDRFMDAASDGERKKLTEDKKKLYGSNGKGGVDPDGLPLGYLLLAHVLLTRCQELYGPSVQTTCNSLGPMLGFGSSAVVFESANNRNHVIKLSRTGQRLLQEAEVLKVLQKEGSPPNSITKLVDEFCVDVKLGTVERKIPALTLSPKGMPLIVAFLCLDGQCDTVAWLEQVLEGLTDGLKYIHSKGFVHGDIKPDSIVVTENETGTQATEIDFSSATRITQRLRGFLETPSYGHKAVFEAYPDKVFCGREEFDCFGLGLTMTVVMNGGKRPWRGMEPIKLTDRNRLDFERIMTQRMDDANAANRSFLKHNQGSESLFDSVDALLSTRK